MGGLSAALSRRCGPKGPIPLVEPDTAILGICSSKNIRLAVAIEIPDGQAVPDDAPAYLFPYLVT